MLNYLNIRPRYNRPPGPPTIAEAETAFARNPQWDCVSPPYVINPVEADNSEGGGEASPLGIILLDYLGAANALAFIGLALLEGAAVNDLVAPLLGCEPHDIAQFLDHWRYSRGYDTDVPLMRQWNMAHGPLEVGLS